MWLQIDEQLNLMDNYFIDVSGEISQQDKQGGQIGLVVDCEWAESCSDRVEDINAAATRLDFQLGW